MVYEHIPSVSNPLACLYLHQSRALLRENPMVVQVVNGAKFLYRRIKERLFTSNKRKFVMKLYKHLLIAAAGVLNQSNNINSNYI